MAMVSRHAFCSDENSVRERVNGSGCPSTPDNSSQLVIAVIYEHHKREDMGLKQLGLSRDKEN